MGSLQVAETSGTAVVRATATATTEREQDADRAADRALTMRRTSPVGQPAAAAAGRRHTSGGIEDGAFGAAGQPLAPADLAFMQPRLGADFSGVRVHADRAAAVSARALGARALAVGQHVAFGDRAFAPGTQDGRRLLAHELAHVVQQDRSGVLRVDRKITRDATAAPLDQAAVDELTDAELTAQMHLVRAFLTAHPGDAGVKANLMLMERAAGLRQAPAKPENAPPAGPAPGAAPAAAAPAAAAPAGAAPARRAPGPVPPEVERSPAHQRLLAEVMQAHWQQAAELLNAYNVDVMRSVLAELHPRQVESVYLGAVANNRVGGEANVAVEVMAASPELGSARQAALASGLTMREVVDYVTLPRGDVIDRHGLVRFFKIKDLMRALPGSVLSHLLPAEDSTIYMHASGRVGTKRDETANRLAEVRPSSGIGAVAGTVARAATDDPNIIGAVTATGDLVETGLAGAAPRGYYKGVSAQGAAPANQPALVVGRGGRSTPGPPPSPAAPAAGIPVILPKGQPANDVTAPQAVPARQAAGAEGYEPRPIAGSGPQKPPGPEKPAEAPYFPAPAPKAPAPAPAAPAAPVAQPAAAGPGAATSTWTVDNLMAGSQFQPTQRVVYRSTVDAMAAAMKAGTFNWSGMDDPIIVDGRQILLQGHHRVVAARLANVRIPQSAVSVREGDSGRDPRPWSSVTVKAGEKP